MTESCGPPQGLLPNEQGRFFDVSGIACHTGPLPVMHVGPHGTPCSVSSFKLSMLVKTENVWAMACGPAVLPRHDRQSAVKQTHGDVFGANALWDAM